MRKIKFRGLLVLIASLALVAAACGGDDSSSTASGDSGSTGGTDTVCASAVASPGDLLAKICGDGTIRVSTDPAYPPQSSLNVETGEYEGFDIDVATEIANRLGVEIAWETPAWEALIAGNWGGRWDMSVGSMTVTQERSEVLDFTPAYYFTPAFMAVASDSDVTSVDQLASSVIGVCAGCTYDYYLQGTLNIPGFDFPPNPIEGAEVRGFNTDATAVQALDAGQVDAVLSSVSLLQGKIDKGAPIKMIGDPLFFEPLSVAFDKSSDLDDAALVDAVSGIIEEMQADGTLSSLSDEWFGQDLTKAEA